MQQPPRGVCREQRRLEIAAQHGLGMGLVAQRPRGEEPKRTSVGVLAAVGTLHLGAGRVMISNAVLMALVLAELVKQGGQIVLFRRGA